jgi:cytochrome c oxidase subunit 2
MAFCAALMGAVAFGAGAASASPMDHVNFQPPVTEVMADIQAFDSYVLVISTVICAFVLALLIWAMLFYNRKANPTPRKFTHNMTVEVVWTVVPVLILVAIAWKSFPLLYEQERIPPTELTLKVTGSSWYWNYEYPELGVAFASTPLSREDAVAQDKIFMLATAEPLVVPEDTNVEVLVTSSDVIHAFAVPAFGIKEDAIQGRVNSTWFRVESSRLGEQRTFYGQCSELCGKDHSFMPIEVRVVSRAEFDRWVATQGGQSNLANASGARAEAPAR